MQYLRYPGAGHVIEPPYIPLFVNRSLNLLVGTPMIILISCGEGRVRHMHKLKRILGQII